MRTLTLPAGGRANLGFADGSKRLLALAGDERLVEQIRRGNEAAFEVAFERHSPGMLSFCRHMLGSREEAEDAVQHTFAAAYRDLTDGREREIKLKPWLYTIARNRSLSMLRARREEPTEAPEVATAGLQDDVQRRADLRELLADLEELPHDQREALLLAEVADMPHAEVAKVLDCEVPKVKALVFRARSGLMQRRQARETPCHEIREQLATLRGGSLRRTELRHHLRHCEGCRQFREEVRRQRAMLAMVLPVTPSLGLKSSVLAAVGIGGGSAGGGAAAAGALGGGAAATAPASTATLAKLAVIGALVGGGVVGGDAVLDHSHPVKTPKVPAAGATKPAAQETGGASRPVSTGGHSNAGSRHGRRVRRRAHRRHRAKRQHRAGGGNAVATPQTPAHGSPTPPAVSNPHAGPKPVPPQSHAKARGRPAPAKPPVRRHGQGAPGHDQPKLKEKPPQAGPKSPQGGSAPEAKAPKGPKE